MNWRETAKRFGFLNWLNAQLKSNKLKWELAKLANDYKRRSASLGYKYDADLTVQQFKSWHRV